MQARVISFHYTLKNREGSVLDSSRDSDPLSYLEGSGQIIPGLEVQMAKLNVGDKKNITVTADQGYGLHDATLIFDIPRTQFPEGQIKEGDRFQASLSEDGEQMSVFTVKKLTDTHVSVDGNHPLAGEDLFFDVEVTEIRPATADEMAHGHAHGPNGHHH